MMLSGLTVRQMKCRDSPQLTTSMQSYVTYYTAAFPSYRVLLPTHLVIGQLPKDLLWNLEEDIKGRSHAGRSLVQVSAQRQQGAAPRCLCVKCTLVSRVIKAGKAARHREQGLRFPVRQQKEIPIPNLTLPASVTLSSSTWFTDVTIFCGLVWKVNLMMQRESCTVRLFMTLNLDIQKVSPKKVVFTRFFPCDKEDITQTPATDMGKWNAAVTPGLSHTVTSCMYFPELTLHSEFHQ